MCARALLIAAFLPVEAVRRLYACPATLIIPISRPQVPQLPVVAPNPSTLGTRRVIAANRSGYRLYPAGRSCFRQTKIPYQATIFSFFSSCPQKGRLAR